MDARLDVDQSGKKVCSARTSEEGSRRASQPPAGRRALGWRARAWGKDGVRVTVWLTSCISAWLRAK